MTNLWPYPDPSPQRKRGRKTADVAPWRSNVSTWSSVNHHLRVDAIVTRQRSLLGAGGVDGAIHSRRRPRLLDACRQLGAAIPANAKLTPGFDLPSRWVIHTVVRSGKARRDEAATLRPLLSACLAIAAAVIQGDRVPVRISTGAYAILEKRLDRRRRNPRRPRRIPDLEVTVVCFGPGLESLSRRRSL